MSRTTPSHLKKLGLRVCQRCGVPFAPGYTNGNRRICILCRAEDMK